MPPDHPQDDVPTVVGPGEGPRGGRDREQEHIEDQQREVRARLKAIDGLRDDGVISDDEYRKARDITLLGPAGAAAASGPPQLPSGTGVRALAAGPPGLSLQRRQAAWWPSSS